MLSTRIFLYDSESLDHLTPYLLPLKFLSHQPETILSFISSFRPIFNSSLTPALVGDSEKDLVTPVEEEADPPSSLWEQLNERDETLKWYRLVALSDTLQFSPRMSMPDIADETHFALQILTPLIRDNPYFTRTLKQFSSKRSAPSSSSFLRICFYLGRC